MRTRNLKPGFFKNDILGSMDPLCRILFSGLWCLADREGRLEDRPRRIKAELLPFDDCDCDALLYALTENEFIVRYEASGRRYIQIVNFTRHQHPHMKEAPSEIPPVGGDEKPSEEANFFAPDEHRANPSLNLKPQTLNRSLRGRGEMPSEQGFPMRRKALSLWQRRCSVTLKKPHP